MAKYIGKAYLSTSPTGMEPNGCTLATCPVDGCGINAFIGHACSRNGCAANYCTTAGCGGNACGTIACSIAGCHTLMFIQQPDAMLLYVYQQIFVLHVLLIFYHFQKLKL